MTHITFDFVVETFLLLLIGIGPKIVLVPFLETTATMDEPTKRRVSRKMLVTAATVAVILLGLGEFLTRLLHFSTAALSVAGGIVLLIISITMVLGAGGKEVTATTSRDPMLLAVYPLAVPYLLNPVGIVGLVTLSADSDSWSTFGVDAGVLAAVLAIDILVIRRANKASEHLDESRMLITEKVFGVLLAAVAVQLVLDGLHAAGVIHLNAH